MYARSDYEDVFFSGTSNGGEERTVYTREFVENVTKFEQAGIHLSELEGYDIYNHDDLKQSLETLHPLLADLIKKATTIETQNDVLLAMQEFDNKTRPLKNIHLLAHRESDVELRQLRQKII
ncbi:MAG TPA: hypothetical protein VJY43_04205 [Methanocorpusculum sp.]|nr:hypothetical protein [Methanocorpusculum sp.]